MKRQKFTNQKKLFFALLLLMGIHLKSNAQCLTATSGQWPTGTVTINCTGNPQNITTVGYAGEYSVISITSGTAYTFTSSVGTDFITISNAGGTTALASGATPLTWTSTVTGTVRFYTHTDAACGEEEEDRTRAVTCAAPACPAPTAVAVNSVTMTSANVTWSGTGNFIVEYGPAGFTPGTGASAGAGGTVIAGATSPQALSGLSGTTTYNVYVRNNCTAASNGYSTNSAMVAFTTPGLPPANDNCSGATALSVTTTCTPVNGTTMNATASGVLPTPTCGAGSSGWDDDVWYTFTTGSTQTAVDMNFTSLTGTDDLVAQIYSSSDGTCGGTLTAVACSDDDNGSLPAFSSQPVLPNTTYFVRVYSFSSTIGTTANSNFTICVNIPPPPPMCVTNNAPANGTTNLAVAPAAVFSWNSAVGATDYEVYLGTSVASAASIGSTTDTFVSITGLGFGTTYYWYIVPSSPSGTATGCSSNAFSFTTAQAPAGASCTDPLVVNTTPYTFSGNTANYGNAFYNGAPGSNGCGTTNDYLDGDDVVFRYTPSATGTIDIALSGIDDWTGVFVYNSCDSIGVACKAGAVNGSAGGDLSLSAFPVTFGQNYYIVVSTWPSPQNTLFNLSVTGTAPLPVRMSPLTGALQTGNLAKLNWSTFSEENNSSFEIQRSEDGRYFIPAGYVASKAEGGKSNEKIDYTFTDNTPVTFVSYYRLKQTDRDGKEVLSNIVALNAKDNGSALSLAAFPNPFKHTIQINTYGVQGANAWLIVTDIAGKQVQKLKVNKSEMTLDMSGFSNGVYLIKYIDDLQSQTIKVNKQ